MSRTLFGFFAAGALAATLAVPRAGLADAIADTGAGTFCNDTQAVVASCSSNPGGNNQATAFADLATGVLQGSGGVDTTPLGYGGMQAELKDTITLVLPDDYPGNSVTLTLSLSFPSVTAYGEAGVEANLYIFPGTANPAIGGNSVNTTINGRNGTPTSYYGSLYASVTDTLSLSQLSDIPIEALLEINVGNDAGAGYASADPNLSITLPAGVTFTSASGVLLTQANVNVPEPASLTLLGTALLGLGALRRDRRRKRLMVLVAGQ